MRPRYGAEDFLSDIKYSPSSLMAVTICLLVSLTTFKWLPYISPEILKMGKLILFLSFLSIVSIELALRYEIGIPINIVLVILPVLLLIYSMTGGPETAMLYFIFGITLLILFTNIPSYNIFYNTLVVYSISVTIQSVYALLSTFTFFPAISLQHVNLTTLASATLFGFRTGNNLGIILGTGAVCLSGLVFINKTENRPLIASFWLICMILVVSHLTIFVVLAGTGRNGVLIFLSSLMFFALVVSEQRKKATLLLLLPPAFWLQLYLVYSLFPSLFWNTITYSLREFFSGRILLYMGTLELIFEELILINSPSGIGLENFSQILPTAEHFRTVPNQSHNLLLNVLLNKGVIVGILLLFWFLKISYASIPSDRSRSNPGQSTATVIVLSHLFVAMFVGGSSPFSLFDGVIWWIAMAYAVGDHSHSVLQKTS